jgi:hypothetical protein
MLMNMKITGGGYFTVLHCTTGRGQLIVELGMGMGGNGSDKFQREFFTFPVGLRSSLLASWPFISLQGLS